MLIDSHCHLDRLDLAPYDGDLSKAIAAAKERGVSKMLCISISNKNVHDVLAIANQYQDVYATVGLHPLNVDEQGFSVDDIVELTKHEKVIGIGESGLDYFYEKSEENHQLQQQHFIRHLQASKQTKNPIIIHTRDAKQDTLNLIKEYGCEETAGILHCFTEDWDMAKQAMDMNYYISISGIVTFKNAENVREVAKQIPLDRLLIETDSPYLAPLPYRGKQNEPKYVREVAQYMADLRNLSIEELGEITSNNFNRLFEIE